MLPQGRRKLTDVLKKHCCRPMQHKFNGPRLYFEIYVPLFGAMTCVIVVVVVRVWVTVNSATQNPHQ